MARSIHELRRAGLGECQGSGSTPYRVVVETGDLGYKCTCPSRKFPCKHSLALMWMQAEGKAAFTQSSPPDWVTDWLRRRRPSDGARAQAADSEAEKQETKSIRAALAVDETAADPKAEARAAAARERNRRDREESILAGLDDLETWLPSQREVDRGEC